MYNYIGWIGLIAILIIDCTNAVPRSDFISFGQSHGDSQFSGIHRAASFAIEISPRIPYFNETYNEIFVSLVSIVYTNLYNERYWPSFIILFGIVMFSDSI